MPYVHGLTIGEIARWAVATPGVLDLDEATRRRGSLEVIPLRNWSRDSGPHQTGPDLDCRTSPFIATPQAARLRDDRAGDRQARRVHARRRRPAAVPLPPRRSAQGRPSIVAALGRAAPGLTLEPRTLAGDGTQGVYTTVADWARSRAVRDLPA
jgi:hypothetical protein